MSAVKITQKIKGFKVVNEAEEQALAAAAEAASVVQMDETLERPDTLIGATYKIKSPLFEHALYVTINDMVLNAGTAHEQRRPFEIFINSKNMDHFQWMRLFLAEKRAAYEAAQGTSKVEPGEGFPAGAQLCGKCNSMAVVQMDGCATCLNCGHSKCG